VLVLLVWAAGCAVASVACRSGTPAARRAERVVLVSLDGLGQDLLERWLVRGDVVTADGLGGMASTGAVAERVRMANPTLTAVNHATLITGAWPSQTGVVGNAYRTYGRPVTERSNGFAAPFVVKPLWQRAREAGLRTGVLLWPGADGGTPAAGGDFGIAWPGPAISRSRLESLRSDGAVPERELPPGDGLDAIAWEVPVEGRDGEVAAIRLAVLDATPDGRPRYDTAAYRVEGTPEWHYLAERDWFQIVIEVERDGVVRRYGSWSKLLSLDTLRGEARLYRGAFNSLPAYPEGFATRLESAVGPWPGVPDDPLLAEWWLDGEHGIDLDTYVEQVERLDRYLDAIAAWVFEHESFDFLVAYHPSPDEFLHANLLRDRTQWAWSEGRAFAARAALDRVGRSADASVAALWTALDPERDVLSVVSDHGLLPIHDEVLVNRVLADAGLVTIDSSPDGPVVAPATRMVAVTSGSSAHVYLNLEGREPDGVVRESEVPALLRRAARALADLGVDGEPVVEKIASRRELASLGLDHPNAGDLVVFLQPGYAASHRLEGEAIRPSRYYGQHGYLAHHDAMCGVFLARGGPVDRGRLGEIRAIDVAPMVAGWLGLDFSSP
jgi:predicted AlkP superfamily phosphohydrolase/phosphomutase